VLKDLAGAYLSATKPSEKNPVPQSEPWKTGGIDWHLSQEGISKKHDVRWKPATLMALVGRLKSIDPAVTFDWRSKVCGQIGLAGGPKNVGKVVTNMGRGIRVELRAPHGVLTPARVDSLGEDVAIRPFEDFDSLIFWLRDLSQSSTKQLREVWRLCGHGSERQRRARSA